MQQEREELQAQIAALQTENELVKQQKQQLEEKNQQIKALVDDWNLRVQDVSHKSSPRYQKAIELLEELRKLV